jgi:uncharacterized protein (DUF58 family)
VTIQQIVARRLKLFTRRRAVNILDGNYDSIFKGRGIELDSLREYIFGDNIKDIDWRATARTQTVFTRQYTPLRDQRILVVADTSSSMLLDSRVGAKKLDILFGVLVTMGIFVRKNRDVIALCSGQPDGSISTSKFSNTSNHLEKLLRNLDATIHLTPPGRSPSVKALLQHLQTSLKQRTAIFIVTDEYSDITALKPQLVKLSKRHQLFWLQVDTSWPFVQEQQYGSAVIDVENGQRVSNEIALNKTLQKEWLSAFNAALQVRKKICAATGIPYGTLLPEELRKMFIQAKHYAKRH